MYRGSTAKQNIASVWTGEANGCPPRIDPEETAARHFNTMLIIRSFRLPLSSYI